MARDLEALRDDPFALLQAMEARLRAARQELVGGEHTWVGLGFRVGERWLVAPRGEVREVLPLPTAARVPGAAPWLLGVANVRGNLLPLTDLGRLLGVSSGAARREGRLLVLNSDTVPAGFLVDEVVGHRSFVPGDQRHELAREAGAWAPFLLGAFAREGRAWLVVSLYKVARSDAFVRAAA